MTTSKTRWDYNMDSTTKDSLANLTTVGGIGLTMAEVQTTISVLVLITALILNGMRIYDWFKKRDNIK